jgi:hypothetical protein
MRDMTFSVGFNNMSTSDAYFTDGDTHLDDIPQVPDGILPTMPSVSNEIPQAPAVKGGNDLLDELYGLST